jgi:hypothetical protein
MKFIISFTALLFSLSVMADSKGSPIVYKDEVVKGESKEQRVDVGNQPPGSRQELIRGPKTSANNDCMDEAGHVFTSKDKGHKKCVDHANRIK